MNHDFRPDGPSASQAQESTPPIAIECYEGPDSPSGGQIEFDDEDLVRHILICGASGAGKSFLISALTRRLIARQANVNSEKVGLLIFDLKGDDTVQKIRAAANEVGRGDDVRVLSMTDNLAYDFFGPCKTVHEVSEYADRLLFACGSTSSDRFWDEYRHGLLVAALTWHVVSGKKPDFSLWIDHAASWILADTPPPTFRDEIAKLGTQIDQLGSGPAKLFAAQAARTITEFQTLDNRTRSNVRACVANAINPLMTPDVLRLMDTQERSTFRVSDLFDGRILIFSINSFLFPTAASLLAKSIKADFYKLVMSRGAGDQRLVTLIVDEYPLCATSGQPRFDDAVALPLLRSFRASVISATQSIAGIDRSVGLVNRKVILPNFGTTFFLRTSEPECQLWASDILGKRRQRTTEFERTITPDPGGWPVERTRRIERDQTVHVCDSGALGRLQVGQAYVHTPSKPVSHQPVWIAG